MSKPIRHCPTCNHTVEFDRVITATGAIAFKCCNCWAHYSEREIAEMSSTPKRREADNAVSATHR